MPKKYNVIKHNELIKTFAFNKLTVSETQVIHYLISQIKPKTDYNPEYSVDTHDIAKVYGVNKYSAKATYIKAIEKLYDRDYQYINENGKPMVGRFIESREDASSNEAEESSITEFRLGYNFSKLVVNVRKNFTLTQLKILSQFKRKYTPHLYDFFKMKEKIKYMHQDGSYNQNPIRAVKWSVDDVRKNLGVEGEGYLLFKNLNSRVIKCSIDEINEKSDIYAKYYQVKNKRTVGHVVFTWIPKNIEGVDQDTLNDPNVTPYHLLEEGD